VGVDLLFLDSEDSGASGIGVRIALGMGSNIYVTMCFMSSSSYKVDLHLVEDLQRLNNYKDREDCEKYSGMGIIESLQYTMKNYLRQTGGNLANDKRAAWEIKAVNKMVCHNNHAERPFAVLKALAQLYPSLSLRNLSRLVHSLVNGTHRCAVTVYRE
jgi:hypothetical protein